MDKRVPLGMLYLGSSLKKAGYRVKAFHIPEKGIDQYLSRIAPERTLFVAVTSIMTGFSLRAATLFSRKLRARYPSLPIIWGGVQPSAIPEICLKEDYVDGVGIGEGEESIVEIARAYQGEIDFSKIQGYAYKGAEGEIFVHEGRRFIREIDTVSPDYSLIPLQDYLLGGSNITGLFMSSRGCPFDCSFCYNNSFNHRRWRAHSEEFVLDSILRMQKEVGFTNISFSDDNFMVDKKRAFSILGRLAKAGIRVYSIDLRIKDLSEEEVRELNDHKVISIFFGTESLNDRFLEQIRKEHRKKDVITGLTRLDRYPNINVQTEILMGFPFETQKEMIQDIREGLKLYQYHRNFSLYYGVLFPLPKTEIFESIRGKGFELTSLSEFAEIDLTNVWRICDRWLPWANQRVKRRLYWTERYSEIIQLNRIKTGGFVASVIDLMNRFEFSIARWRLFHQFFLGSQLDFFVYRNRFRPVSWGLKRIRRMVEISCPVAPEVKFHNFGYLATGSLRDIRGKLFGHVNLLKRLQAKDVIVALDLQREDVVLDFGCGSGYFTVEMAKLSRKVCGIDVTPYLHLVRIPPFLKGRLHFIPSTGERLPFHENTFDKILASEVLPMTRDPEQFLLEMRRVLKKKGRLVICNGAGHPAIKDAYLKRHWILTILRKIYRERVPKSYEEYCRILQGSFGTCQSRFFEAPEMENLLKSAGFELEVVRYSPGFTTGSYLSWSQFWLFLRKGKTLSNSFFYLRYPFAALLNRFEKCRYEGGLICIARKV